MNAEGHCMSVWRDIAPFGQEYHNKIKWNNNNNINNGENNKLILFF